MHPVRHKNEIETAQVGICRENLIKVLPWLILVSCSFFLIKYVEVSSFMVFGFDLEPKYLVNLSFVVTCIGLIVRGYAYFLEKNKLNEYRNMNDRILQTKRSCYISDVQNFINEVENQYYVNQLVKTLVELNLPDLKNYLFKLRKQDFKIKLQKEFNSFEKNCDKQIAAIKSESPLVKAKNSIETSLEYLEQRRDEIKRNWQIAYKNFSWWNKLKYGEEADLSEMNKVIAKLQYLDQELAREHKEDFKKLDAHLQKLKSRAVYRVTKTRDKLEILIDQNKKEDLHYSDLLKKAYWFSAFSIPISIWGDVSAAGNVYGALRQVNGNFADMSNTEIWWETLFMPSESLVGLASLTKGAYFEQLVASDTGGQLHEYFNHPDTDIVIDGVAYQIKATGSVGYINTVDEDIAVISTSEVALSTGSIDSGYSDEDLTNAVDLALGGTVVDVGDTGADAILTGLGGLGFFATIEGINHASKKYENGGDAVESMFEGAGVAIEGTARALVGTAEMGYKVLTSRPSRFVGRTLLSGLKKLDDKLMSESTKK